MAQSTTSSPVYQAAPVMLLSSPSHRELPTDAIPNKEVTIKSLKIAHEQSVLKNGYTTKQQQKEIIDAIGGFDIMLTKFFESDINLSITQLQSMHQIFEDAKLSDKRIISSTADQGIEDKGYGQNVTYKFVDSDMILYQLFSEHIAKCIISILTSTKLKTFLFTLLCLGPIVLIASHRISGEIGFLPIEFYNAYEVFFCIWFSLYAYTWILCANKEAMKMLLKTFVFWFKMFYLMIYLVTLAMILKIDKRTPGHPIYHSVPMAIIMKFGWLSVTMITDALNISQTTKIVLSSGAFAQFSLVFLWMQQQASYGWSPYTYGRVYEFSYISFPFSMTIYIYSKNQIYSFKLRTDFGFGSMGLNVADILNNAAQILMIFSMKQILSTLIRPNKASVVRVFPKLEYEKKDKNTKVTLKSIIVWGGANVCWALLTIIISLIGLVGGIISKANKILIGITIAVGIVSLALLVIGGCQKRLKLLYIANAFALMLLILVFISILLVLWHPVTVLGPILGFGFSVMFTLRLSQMLSQNDDDDGVNESVEGVNRTCTLAMDGIDTVCMNTNISVQVKANDIQNEHAYDNTDRAETIELSVSYTDSSTKM